MPISEQMMKERLHPGLQLQYLVPGLLPQLLSALAEGLPQHYQSHLIPGQRAAQPAGWQGLVPQMGPLPALPA